MPIVKTEVYNKILKLGKKLVLNCYACITAWKTILLMMQILIVSLRKSYTRINILIRRLI